MSFLVALHGPLSSLFQPLGVSRAFPTPSWPFAVLRGPSWISPFPGPFFGDGGSLSSLSSLLQPLRGPSPFFVALRGYLFAFSWKSFLPLAALADPSRASSNPFVALRRSSWPFVDIFLPFPGIGRLLILSPLGGPWRIPLEPPPTPSWPFAVLRGPSWISFCLFVEILSPLGDPWQTPLELPPTP